MEKYKLRQPECHYPQTHTVPVLSSPFRVIFRKSLLREKNAGFIQSFAHSSSHSFLMRHCGSVCVCVSSQTANSRSFGRAGIGHSPSICTSPQSRLDGALLPAPRLPPESCRPGQLPGPRRTAPPQPWPVSPQKAVSIHCPGDQHPGNHREELLTSPEPGHWRQPRPAPAQGKPACVLSGTALWAKAAVPELSPLPADTPSMTTTAHLGKSPKPVGRILDAPGGRRQRRAPGPQHSRPPIRVTGLGFVSRAGGTSPADRGFVWAGARGPGE